MVELFDMLWTLCYQMDDLTVLPPISQPASRASDTPKSFSHGGAWSLFYYSDSCAPDVTTKNPCHAQHQRSMDSPKNQVVLVFEPF